MLLISFIFYRKRKFKTLFFNFHQIIYLKPDKPYQTKLSLHARSIIEQNFVLNFINSKASLIYKILALISYFFNFINYLYINCVKIMCFNFMTSRYSACIKAENSKYVFLFWQCIDSIKIRMNLYQLQKVNLYTGKVKQIPKSARAKNIYFKILNYRY